MKLMVIFKQEIVIQNRINNLLKYSFIFSLFCSSTINLINAQEQIKFMGLIFSIIALPLIFINLSQLLITPDINDGTLELLLSSAKPYEIICGKFLALAMLVFTGFLFNLPFFYLIYTLNINQLLLVAYIGFILTTISASLTILISAIQAYFRNNTNILSILIMPIIVPTIIMSGLLLTNEHFNYLAPIMLGVNLIIMPISLALASYLLANIYNMS